LLAQIQSYTTIIGGFMNVVTTNAAGDSTGIAWSAEGDYLVIANGTHFHLAGPGTNSISNFGWAGVSGGLRCTLVLNNVTYDGVNNASGGWLVNNSVSPRPTIIVVGGMLSPTNFTDPSTVTFLTPFLGGSNNWTGSNYFGSAVRIAGQLTGTSASNHISGIANIANLTAGTITNRSLSPSQFVATDSNIGEISTLNANSLTNLSFVQTTNAINTGIGTVGTMMISNLTGNVTLGGFTGLQNDKANTVTWAFFGSGADRTVTDMANCLSTDGTRSYVATNGLWSFATYLIIPGRLTNRINVAAGR
jgi:hypothetical protein